jgi:hypothetical protein
MYILSNKMGGGLMQLVAYGAQDIYLTGNPQITFFKVVYRRHTNFSMEAIEQTWNGSSTTDGRCTATISRNGDLVGRMYIEIETSACVQTDNVGNAWIKSVELEIGGQRIDKQSGYWMEAHSELTEPNSSGLVAISTTTQDGSGAGTLFQRMSGTGGVVEAAGAIDLLHFVPLQFWFCRNPGLALPLIALQYHEVKVVLDHNIVSVFGSAPSNKLWCDYIYLDTEERRRFAQVSHEYLIEQVQEQSLSSAATNSELNFNHPVKELIITCGSAAAGAINSTSLISPFNALTNEMTLKLNGHERFATRKVPYFTRTQVWQHHTGYGGLDSTDAGLDGNGANDSIAVYSFALKPEEHQPSGTCNFSRIDNAQLVMTTGAFATSGNVKCFAVNYNVLRVMSGMGGLAYSN